MRVVRCDGSVRSALAVHRALAEALAGGPAVLPVPDGPGADRLIEAARPELGSDAAAVVATSGSAGEPKLVELSAAALTASAGATHDRLGGPGGWLLALPVGHVAGLQVLVRCIVAGVEPVVLDLRGGFRAGTFAGRARYTALVPTQLARLLDAGGTALRGFDAVLVGGGPAAPGLVARAAAAGIRVITTYGMTETAGGCVYDGLALRDVRVRLDGDGRIHLGGPTLATGYRLRPELTAAAFDGGWFRTGDLGRVTADGRLEVVGRIDDVIITGGRKVAPELVERVLDADPAIAESCVVGLPDPEWGRIVTAAVVPVAGVRPDVDAVRAAVREQAGPEAVPKIVEVVAELPRRGIGKIDRDAVQRYLTERHERRSQRVD